MGRLLTEILSEWITKDERKGTKSRKANKNINVEAMIDKEIQKRAKKAWSIPLGVGWMFDTTRDPKTNNGWRTRRLRRREKRENGLRGTRACGKECSGG